MTPVANRQKDKTSTAPENSTTARPGIDSERIARRAYELYEARGREDGRDVDDWLAAEHELAHGSSRTPAEGAGEEGSPR